MIGRLAPYGIAGLIAAGAVWWLMDLRADLAYERAENARLTRSLAAMTIRAENAAIARDVERARVEVARKREAAARTTVSEIQNLKLGECADAPLDPELADILNRVR